MNLNLPLSSGAVAHLINKLNNMEAELQSKKELFLDALADFGVRQIEQRIAKAASKPYNISVQTWADGSKSIVVDSEEVCFLEFGTGVHYNGSESYPDPSVRQNLGVAGIGQYGKHKGQQDTWVYYGTADRWTFRVITNKKGMSVAFTHGIPAQGMLWYTSEEMQRMVEYLAKEIFK